MKGCDFTDAKTLNTIRWAARIAGTLMFILFFPFYIGYGLPLPRPSYSFYENTWLVVMPVFLGGLVAGWFSERIGGMAVTGSLAVGFLVSLVLWEAPAWLFALPLVPGVLYLVCGFGRRKNEHGHPGPRNGDEKDTGESSKKDEQEERKKSPITQ